MRKTAVRGLTALTLTGALSLVGVNAAQAAPCAAGEYPPAVNCEVAVGSTVTLQFGGFVAGSKVRVFVGGVLVGTFTADANGNVFATFRLPAGVRRGNVPITATGGGVTVTRTINVLGNGSVGQGAGGGLPFTGAEIGVASLLGFGLVGAGGVAVIAGRRRKSLAAV